MDWEEAKVAHEAIVESFLASKAIDFNNLATFISDQGPRIARLNQAEYGVIIGHYNIQACFNILGPRAGRVVDVAASGMAESVTGKA